MPSEKRPNKAREIAEKKKIALDYYRGLPVYKYAAQAAGTSIETLTRWRNEDPEFDRQLEEAGSSFYGRQARRLKPEFMVERLDKEVWSPPKQEVGVTVDAVGEILKGFGIDATREAPPTTTTTS